MWDYCTSVLGQHHTHPMALAKDQLVHEDFMSDQLTRPLNTYFKYLAETKEARR